MDTLSHLGALRLQFARLIFPAAAKPHVEQASSQRAEVGIFYRHRSCIGLWGSSWLLGRRLVSTRESESEN